MALLWPHAGRVGHERPIRPRTVTLPPTHARDKPHEAATATDGPAGGGWAERLEARRPLRQTSSNPSFGIVRALGFVASFFVV